MTDLASSENSLTLRLDCDAPGCPVWVKFYGEPRAEYVAYTYGWRRYKGMIYCPWHADAFVPDLRKMW